MNNLKIIITFFTTITFSFINGQESQSTILQNFESGKYTVYKLDSNKEFIKVKKTWPVEITKQGNDVTKVLVKRSGILDELFKADVLGYPAYFAFKQYRLSFIENYAVYYEWNGKQEAKTKYILVKPGSGFKGKPKDINTKVSIYAQATFKNQTGARAVAKVTKGKLAETERKQNSLQGKQVSKIQVKLINNPSKVAHFSEAIEYGVIATLKNGKLLKTTNLGGKIPWDDFKLSHIGCSNTIDQVKVEENASKFPNDKIIIKVTSKYHPTLTSSKSISTTNDVPLQVSRNGFYGADRARATNRATFGASQRGGNGHSLTVKVKRVKHKQTGEALNKIEIYDNSKKEMVAQYKLTPSTKLIINSYGGKGQWGTDGNSSSTNGDNGGAGGNGGNVTIIKDPSVIGFNVVVNNIGGKGGAGGKRYNASGSSGSRGSSGKKGAINRQTKSISLKF